jgi:hypothetical protein
VSRRRLGAGLVALLAWVVQPGIAHADAAGPTDFRTEIVGVEPSTPALEVTIEGGDSFVHLTLERGHEAIVLGYAGEPYLRFDADGTVFENRRSYATYYNRERDGTGEVPDTVDNEAPPDWVAVGDGGSWAWHDHRAHWMGGEPPVGMQPGEVFPPAVVPLVVDGQPVEIEVVTRLVAPPSPWPMVAGAAIGVAAAAAVWRSRRRPGERAVTASMTGLVSASALALGAIQFTSLPGETGPRPVWWVAPLLAALCGLALAARPWGAITRIGLAAAGAGQLLVWAGERRAGLERPVLPTDAPGWLDRVGTATAGAFAAGLLVTLATEVFRLVRQPASVASIASLSSS